jgi:hypothetical protein
MECEQTNTTSAQKVFPNSNPVAKQESLSLSEWYQFGIMKHIKTINETYDGFYLLFHLTEKNN